MNFVTRFLSGSLQDRLVAMVLAMVLVIALVAAPASNRSPGIAPMVLEAFAVLIIAAMVCVGKWNIRRDNVQATFKTGTSIAALSLAGIALVSCLFSHNRAVSFQGALQIGIGVLLYCVVNYQFRHSQQISRLADVFTIAALIGAIYGCADYGYREFGSHLDSQATGMFGDHQLYGSFLMIMLPFVAISAMTEKVINRQLAAQTATVLTIIAMLLAHSRSAWIGSAVGLMAVGALAWFIPGISGRKLDDKRKLLVPALLLAAGVGFFMMVSPLSTSVLNRATTLTSVSNLDAWQDRQQIWHGALRMIADHPITGLGPSMYAYSHHAYTKLGMPIGQLHLRPSLSDQTHNLYLQTAAEIGIPGLLALVVTVVTFWIAGIRRLSSLDRGLRRNILLGALGATIAFAVDAFASPSWQFGQVMIFFWLALGIGMACIREAPKLDVARKAASFTSPTWFKRSAAATGLLSVAAFAPVAVLAAGQYPATSYFTASGGPTGVGAVTDTAAAAAVGGSALIYAITPHEAHLELIEVGGANSDGDYEFRLMLYPKDGSAAQSVAGNTDVSWTVTTGGGTLSPMQGTDLEIYHPAASDAGTTVTVTATYKLGNTTFTVTREIDVPLP